LDGLRAELARAAEAVEGVEEQLAEAEARAAAAAEKVGGQRAGWTRPVWSETGSREGVVLELCVMRCAHWPLVR
jgi:hypothetical protein